MSDGLRCSSQQEVQNWPSMPASKTRGGRAESGQRLIEPYCCPTPLGVVPADVLPLIMLLPCEFTPPPAAPLELAIPVPFCMILVLDRSMSDPVPPFLTPTLLLAMKVLSRFTDPSVTPPAIETPSPPLNTISL